MRSICFAVLLVVPSVHALETGGRYDFFCDHGQDIINAELIGEDDTSYYVRLSVSVNKVPIGKKNVLRTVLKAPPASTPQKTRFMAGVLGGIGIATGRLADFTGVTPAATLYASYEIMPRLSLIFRTDFMRFASGEASLRSLAFLPGVAYEAPWRLWRLRFSGGLAAGSAWLYAVADRQSLSSFTPALLVFAAVSYDFSERFGVIFTADTTYLYDAQTMVMVPALKLGASYRL